MTQLIVSLEDPSMISEIKRAIELLRGVISVRAGESEEPNDTTIKAFAEYQNGETMVCENFQEYLKLVDDELQD